MKPYRKGAAVLFLFLLVSCTSLTGDREGPEEGTGRGGQGFSRDIPAVSATPEEVAGDGHDHSEGPPQDVPAAPAIVVSWPAVPGAGEMPRPEGMEDILPEPYMVFPHIIQVPEADEKAAKEEGFPDDPASSTGAPQPENTGDGTSFFEEGAGERSNREAAVALSSAGESRRSEERVAASDPRQVNEPFLPGWNTVESREDKVYFVSDRDPHSLILEGSGWTLKSSQGIHTNLERGLQPGITIFTFLLPREGTGQFLFQRQDLSAKILYFKTVSYRGTNPPAADASVSDNQEAVTGASLPEPAGGEGAVSVPEIIEDVSREDTSGSVVSGVEGEGDPGIDGAELMDTDSLFNAATRYYQGADYPGLARVLAQLQGRDLPYWEQDRLLLFLGRLHDLDSPLRDERAALDYYNQLVDQYPGSLYWEEANRRARYIRRHFFQIR